MQIGHTGRLDGLFDRHVSQQHIGQTEAVGNPQDGMLHGTAKVRVDKQHFFALLCTDKRQIEHRRRFTFARTAAQYAECAAMGPPLTESQIGTQYPIGLCMLAVGAFLDQGPDLLWNQAQHRQTHAQAQLDKTRTLTDKTTQRLNTYREEQYDLTAQRNILAHDVELDSLFNVLKVGLTLLVTYVLGNMLDNARMSPLTFLERIATLPAWSRVTDTHEYLTFRYNTRDPATMALLAASCSTINATGLRTRAGVILHVAVQDDPRKKKDDTS